MNERTKEPNAKMDFIAEDHDKLFSSSSRVIEQTSNLHTSCISPLFLFSFCVVFLKKRRTRSDETQATLTTPVSRVLGLLSLPRCLCMSVDFTCA